MNRPTGRLVSEFQAFLRAERVTFACAESCTGGLVAQQMTALAGSSEVFWGGVVTYSNEAKMALLGVDPGVLAAHGAVSAPVALAMVQGLVRVSGAGLVVSVTGIAGPDGGSEAKPVGTVWFGLGATKAGLTTVTAVQVSLVGTRQEIQADAARWARVFGCSWWQSGMDLDSIRGLTDNEGKPVVVAFQPPTSFPPPVF